MCIRDRFGDIPLTHKMMWHHHTSTHFVNMDPENPFFGLPPVVIGVGKDQDIYQTNPALRHFARMRPASTLYGSSFFEHTQVDDWLDFGLSTLEPVIVRLAHNGGKKQYTSDAQRQEDIKQLIDSLKILAYEMKTDDPHYIVGNNLTICDISICCLLIPVHRIMFGPEREQFETETGKILAYFQNFLKRPEVIEVLGEIKLGVDQDLRLDDNADVHKLCLLYTSPSPRDQA
eukprot:TRINITY_DN14373_c0_g1_i7.p2 TRINITY_DN14373_c0_g1~~TRINITY_DN14373_c0_g1_i7.p2  ORF type:complete len:231 (-),score=82.86 TRINITY_DN14373_c0_g1_i7:78-770(-)